MEIKKDQKIKRKGSKAQRQFLECFGPFWNGFKLSGIKAQAGPTHSKKFLHVFASFRLCVKKSLHFNLCDPYKILLFLLLPWLLTAWQWSSPEDDLKIFLEPEELAINEKAILKIETSGALIDEKKLRENLLFPLNRYTEKLKIDHSELENKTLTWILIPLVEGNLPLHLEKIPLLDGKILAGQETFLKVTLPSAEIHNLINFAAKPFPLDHHPLIMINSINRFNYIDGEKALDDAQKQANVLFNSKRFPLITLIFIIIGCCAVAAGIIYRKEITLWLKTKIIPPYDPQRHAEKEILKAIRRHRYEERTFLSISETLRIYFGEIFNIHTENMTTSEFIEAFKNISDISEDTLAELQEILHQADLDKFAELVPGSDAINKMADKALEIIHLYSSKRY